MDRRSFVRTAAAGGLTLAGGAVLAPRAAAAPPTDDELAYANFGIAAELLLVDFYRQAAASKLFSGEALAALKRAGFNDAEHATALAKALTDSGQAAPVAEDFTFTWPKGTFASRGAVARLGLKLETALLGVYLAALDATANADLRLAYSRISASEAQHVSVLAGIAEGRPLGLSFPEPLDLEPASAVVGPYLG